MSEDTDIYYPEAIKDHGGKMRVRGAYQHRFPIGAVVHSTDGRPNDGAASAADGAKEQKYAYLVIGRSGSVYQNFSLDHWGSHAGPTLHPVLGSELSTKLVGIEVVSAGKLRKLDDNHYRPWYNEQTPKVTPKPKDDFVADEVRHSEVVGSPAAFGYQTAGDYHKFTEEQEAALVKLLRWLQQQHPEHFKFENVFGHDEIAVEKSGKYGRKSDPGGSLSVPMVAFRDRLKGSSE